MRREVIASVLIPVRNGGEFIHESLGSILSQETEFGFEIIVIDDGSTDDTVSLVSQMAAQNNNLLLIQSLGKGISDALNFGIEKAKGQYLLRHDADDVMAPNRIQLQIDFLTQNPEIVLYGGQIELIGTQSNKKPNSYPLTDHAIKRFIERGNPFAHPTVAINRKLLADERYNQDFDGAEDYQLWIKLLRFGKACNSEAVFTKYRVHHMQITSSSKYKVESATARVQFNLLVGRAKSMDFASAIRIGCYLIFRVSRMILRQGRK